MSTTRARLPYINKEYDAIRQELVARIPQLTDRWTDFNESDLGIVLLELFAGVGDMLAYYLDAQAAECYLPTARQRQSIINLCALVAKAQVLDLNDDTTMRIYTVRVVIAPEGGGVPSPQLKADLRAFLDAVARGRDRTHGGGDHDV